MKERDCLCCSDRLPIPLPITTPVLRLSWVESGRRQASVMASSAAASAYWLKSAVERSSDLEMWSRGVQPPADVGPRGTRPAMRLGS